MNYDAMIIIDMQTALVDAQPYNKENVIQNIKKLMDSCRNNQIPLIFICHDGGKGDELERDTPGWQMYKELLPQRNEKIFHKNYNSAFRKTGLDDYLKKSGFKNLIMCGMQTEYCFDTSCKVAFEYGYHVIIPRGTTTTFDNELLTGEKLTSYYEEKIWNNRFAKLKDVEDLLKEIKDS